MACQTVCIITVFLKGNLDYDDDEKILGHGVQVL